jgi:hypothetical protein
VNTKIPLIIPKNINPHLLLAMRLNLLCLLVALFALLAVRTEASPQGLYKKLSIENKHNPFKTLDTCNHLCPHGINLNHSDFIFASKPNTFVKEILIVGSGRGGSGCCACSTACDGENNCVAFLCAAYAASWDGFNGQPTNCQMFDATTPEPETPSGIARWWQHC